MHSIFFLFYNGAIILKGIDLKTGEIDQHNIEIGLKDSAIT